MTTILTTSVVNTSANVATVLFGIMIVIQLLLAAGVLPVTMVWGGKQEILTLRLRIASIVAAIVLGGFAYFIRYSAGLTGAIEIVIWGRVIAWIITVYMALNTVGNLASQSTTEKIIFAPTTAILTIMCLIVSLS